MILVQGFWLGLKIKITQFPDRFCLNRLATHASTVLQLYHYLLCLYQKFWATNSLLWQLDCEALFPEGEPTWKAYVEPWLKHIFSKD